MKIAICQIKGKVKVHLYPLLENANWYPFYKDASTSVDHFYTGIFESTYIGDRWRSISNPNGTSSFAKSTFATFVNAARANGTGWDIAMYMDVIWISLLDVLLEKSLSFKLINRKLQKSSTRDYTGGLFANKIFGMEFN